MKKVLTILLLGGAYMAQGQYFQQRFNLDYTTPKFRSERCNSGIVTRDNYAGGNPALHYFVGIGTSYNNTTLPAPDNVADRMRFQQLNNVGTAVISNLGYQFADAGTAAWYNSYGNSIAEIKNTSNSGGYVAVGAISNNSITGAAAIAGGSDALFTQLSPGGGVISALRYDVSGGTDRAWCIRKSNVLVGGQATWILCGESRQTATNTVCFVARVLVNGAIVWFNSYSFDPSGPPFNSSINIAKQLCEDTAGNIYVVGTLQDSPAGAQGVDGLAFKLTPAGAVVWVNNYQGYTDDEFQAVRYTADGNLIVGGFTNFGAAAPVTHHMLITKLASANGAVIFQNILRAKKGAPVYTSKCYDIIETAGPQYYLAGPLTAGGVNYEMMYRANAAGLGINWYVYNPMNYNVGFGLDNSNVGAWPGVAYFSSMKNLTTAGVSDSHIMKTDYLGRTCKFCTPYPPSNLPINLVVQQRNRLVQPNANVRQLITAIFKYNDSLICNTAAIACKDNLAAEGPDAGTTSKNAVLKISPNPVSSMMHLELNTFPEGKYKLSVLNGDGITMLQKSDIYVKGNTVVDINLSVLHPGVYLVQLTNGTYSTSRKIMKE